MDKKQIIEDYLQGRHPMEQNSWELPSANELDNAEAEYDQLKSNLTPDPGKKAFLLGGRFGWGLFAAAACVAAVIVVFLAPPKLTEEPHPSASEEPTITSQMPIEYFQFEEGQSLMEAQLAHQQEIKKKGERLAAYIQKQAYPELDY